MDSIKRAIRFQNSDLKKSIGYFWLVIIIVNILTTSIAIYSNFKTRIGIFDGIGDAYSITGSNIMPILIFFLIYGIVMYHEDFTLALGFGVSRKNFYISAMINNLIVALSFALIQATIQKIEGFSVRFLGYDLIVEYGLFNIARDNLLYLVFIFTLLYLAIISITNLLGVLQYRWGYKFWIGVGISILLWTSLDRNAVATKAIGRFLNSYLWSAAEHRTLNILIFSLFTALISYALGYAFIKEADLKNS